MDNPIEEIKSKIDIIEFLSSYIDLKKTGRNFKAICPFHQEKTPSFVISPERQIWHCFGACQEGGDIIKFLMKWENITFYEALRELAQKAGVKLKQVDFEDKTWKRKEKIIEINSLAANFFAYVLEKTAFGKKAMDYLALRKINQKTVRNFQLGYAPVSWHSLLDFLVKKKFTASDIGETGLLVKGDRGNYYDRFRGRLMFPIKDLRGNIIGFSGRMIEGKDTEAKYVNTPETPVYHKRETLYGIDLAKEAIKKTGNVFLVEGEFDMISPYQHGFENFVAIKGSAVTREQLMLLKRYTNRVTLTLDNDEAGEEAAKRGIESAEELELETQVVSFDFAKDPDEAIKADPIQFKKTLETPLPIYDFIITNLQKKYPGNDPYSKKKIGEEISVYLGRIKNPIIKSHYVKKIAAILDVTENTIESLIRTVKKKTKPPIYVKNKPDASKERYSLIQKYLLSLIFQSETPYEISETIFSVLTVEDFDIPAYQKILNIFFGLKDNKHGVKEIAASLPEELRPVFDEVYLYADSQATFSSESLSRLIYQLKKYSLKKQISGLLSGKKDEDAESDNKIKELNRALNEVEKKLSAL